MDKSYSNIIKGIAIIFMLWLHLFNKMSNVELCDTLIEINGIPLAYLLTKATNPVAFFLLVSGYGLYRVYHAGDTNRVKRIMTLLIHYWVVMLLFLLIGHFLYPSIYPGLLLKFIENFTTYKTTYNYEMWFIFPFIILSLASPLYFKLINRGRGALIIITISYLLYIGQSWVIGHFPELVEQQYLVENLLNLFQLQFNFTLGAIAARVRLFENIKALTFNISHISIVSCLLLVGLIYYQIVYGTALYAFIFITLLNIINFPVKISNTLQNLGRHSMDIWLIHTWLCYYLFHNFIYGFKYPVIIFTVLLSFSYMIAIGVRQICNPIEKLFKNKAKPII